MDTRIPSLAENEAMAADLLGREWGLLIDGKICESHSGARFPVLSPYSESQITSAPNADFHDVDRAVDAATAAFPGWSGLFGLERAKLIERLADALEAHAAELAVLDAVNGGAPITAMFNDVAWSAQSLRYFAGLVLEIKGSTVPATRNLHYTERQPYGVVAKIIPFNHPILFAVRAIASPLVAGNTVILKAPDATPLSALLLGEIIRDTLPPGVVNILVGEGPALPESLVAHRAIRRIGFTGSEPVGRAILRNAAEHAVKNVSLELGGKNALIAFPDADPTDVASAAIKNMNFLWSGQSCTSTSRLLVHADIAEAVVESIREQLSKHVIGNPLDPASEQGTIVNERQYQSIVTRIANAVEDGATIAVGGGRPEHLTTGLFIEPTVLTNVDPYSRIAQEEVFGPVLSVITWTDESEAIEIANSTAYGFTAVIFTNDIKRAHRVARKVEAGLIGINGSPLALFALPLGGFKGSGLGSKESCLDELLSYTQEKVVSVALD